MKVTEWIFSLIWSSKEKRKSGQQDRGKAGESDHLETLEIHFTFTCLRKHLRQENQSSPDNHRKKEEEEKDK